MKHLHMSKKSTVKLIVIGSAVSSLAAGAAIKYRDKIAGTFKKKHIKV